MKQQMKRFYQWLMAKKWIRTEGIRRQIAQLYRGTKRRTEEIVETYFVELLMKCFVVGSLTVTISGILWMQEYMHSREGLHIVRSDYGEEEEEYTLRYQDSNHTWNEFSVVIEPVQYQPDELKMQFQQGFDYLEAKMLGENVSVDNIRGNLDLESNIPQSGLTVSWKSMEPEWLDDKGTVHNENLSGPVSVQLQLELSYMQVTESREYALTIQPKILTEEEQHLQQIQEEVEQMVRANPYERDVYISDCVHDVTLYDTKKGLSKGWIVFSFGIGICILLWFRQKEALHKKMKSQKQELMREYPGLVNQLLLYTEAGTTIQGALERMIHQYEKRVVKNRKGNNQKKENTQSQLYVDLCIMWNELHGGIGQEQAYLNLGKRTGLLAYMRLSSLLAQQIRKGTEGFAEQLEQEERDAFEHKKEQAKKAGEEAGTKLLLPMILLMIISMIIVMCPALMNFAM